MTISTTTLKNAARAIECDLFTDSDGCHYLAKDGAILRLWEPEHDSGDSLELVGECELEVYYGWDEGARVYAKAPKLKMYNIMDCSEDKLAATRIAILYAAADIGAAL